MRADAPEVAGVEAELVDAELGGLARVGGGGEAEVVLLGQAGVEVVDAAEAVGPEVVADEEVLELEELVVGADGDEVLALVHREVVGQLDDVLVELVRGRELLGAEADGAGGGRAHPRRQVHPDLGERGGSVADVADLLVVHPQLVDADVPNVLLSWATVEFVRLWIW